MEMYKKILIGIDGSEESFRAANKAALLQRDCGSELIIFHSVKHRLPLPAIPLLFPFTSLQDRDKEYAIPNDDYIKIQEQYEKAGREALKQTIERLKDLKVKITPKLVLDLKPEEYAKKLVEKEGVDLVVVGAKGHHSRLKQAFMGSVAQKILNDVPCDVLIVR